MNGTTPLKIEEPLKAARRQNSRIAAVDWLKVNVYEEEGLLLRCVLMMALKDASNTFSAAEHSLIAECMSHVPLAPPRRSSVQPSRRTRRAPYKFSPRDDEPPLLAGYVDVAQELIAKYGHFTPDLVSRLWRIASSSVQDDHHALARGLVGRGYPDPYPFNFGSIFKDLEARIPKDGYDGWRVVFQAATSLDPNETPLRPSDSWRLPQLSALFDVADFPSITFSDLEDLQSVEVPYLTSWLLAISHAYGLDPDSVGAQARSMLDQPHRHGDAVLDAVLLAEPDRRDNCELSRLTQDDIGVLMEGLESPLRLIRHHATQLLALLSSHEVGSNLENRIQSMSPDARFLANFIICASVGEETLETATRHLGSDDLVRRRSTATFAKMAVTEDERLQPVLRGAMDDPDMTIRASAGADQDSLEQAAYWTCVDCLKINQMSDLDCTWCDTGAGPGEHPS